MDSESVFNDSFRLLRLRFLRPSPSSLLLPSSKTCSIAVEIAVGVTDDYGTEGDAFFSSLDLSLSLIDSTTNQPYTHAKLSFADNSSPSSFTIHSSRGHFHTIKPIVTFQNTSIKPTSFKFLLTLASTSQIPPILSRCSQKMREVIGEENQEPIESWDGSQFIFMRVLSGDVEVVMSGKKGEGSTSTLKVQTAIRTLHIQSSNSTLPSVPLFAVERPGLNNSTGSRLWDCSIGLSCFLSLNPSYLFPKLSNSSSNSNVPPLRIIEVGSGCGLASLAALKIIQSTIPAVSAISSKLKVDIIQTDIEATVNTTLAENLETNLPFSSRSNLDNFTIESKTLDWGILSDDMIKQFLGKNKKEEDDQYLTILGSDILYDPDTHLALHQTINSLLGSTGGNVIALAEVKRKALIAYKARTEGDDGFFELARQSGRQVEKVWEWGEIQVWIVY